LSRPSRLLLVALVVALASACQVKTEVDIDVKADGSGTVTVSVGLDDAAVKDIGDLGAVVRTDDLTKAGWTIGRPAKEADGYTYLRLTKPFANPDEANAIFTQITGPTGPFQGFHLARTREFAKTDTTFDGTVDLTGGLPAFADNALAQQLDGKPLGQDLASIEKAVGGPIDKAFTFRVAVRLPGDVTSNATLQVDNGAVWEPKLSDKAPSVLQAKGSARRVTTLVFIALGIVALIALAVVLIRRARAARRRPEPTPT
jgi:hypothetical protein